MRRLGRKAKVGMAVVLAVLLAATAGLGVGPAAGRAFAAGAAGVEDGRPALPKAKSGPCVADTQVMRRGHFGFILHQRGQTLRLGIRGGKYSLKDCVDCHAATGTDGKPVPVNASGQFCDSCHQYAAVNIDCFSCHAATPAAPRAANTEAAAPRTADAEIGADKTASAAGGTE